MHFACVRCARNAFAAGVPLTRAHPQLRPVNGDTLLWCWKWAENLTLHQTPAILALSQRFKSKRFARPYVRWHSSPLDLKTEAFLIRQLDQF